MQVYRRKLTQKVIQILGENPAVVVLGPCRIGKTTLALEIAQTRPSKYLDLEKPGDFQRLEDVNHYLNLHADELVILDEVQNYPDLFMSLRGIIDARRREGRGNGRFLILGSALDKLLRQRSESLAGRVHYCELTGLNPFEIEKPEGEPLERLWMRGGFPNSYAASSDQASHKWRKNFIRTYLEHDIPQLGPRIPASTLMRFWIMLAQTQGELFNASNLAGPLGVKSITVGRYLELMVDLLLVRKLEPWYGNTKKRLVKSPRTYIRDSGIVHALLQIPGYEELLGHPVRGKSWEGFVIENIISELPFRVRPYFYRTSAGAEIDLLLEFGLDEYWAIEIKSNRTPTLKKGFHIACEDLKVKRKFVVYAGEDEFRGGNETTILSLSCFIETLRERIG